MGVSWCFTPSQPVRLYQGYTHFVVIYYYFNGRRGRIIVLLRAVDELCCVKICIHKKPCKGATNYTYLSEAQTFRPCLINVSVFTDDSLIRHTEST